MSYPVEIRGLGAREFACDCVDFRINALGTCKHVEAVLLHLECRFRRLLSAAAKAGSSRLDVVPHLASGTLRIERRGNPLPRALRPWFGSDDLLKDVSPAQRTKNWGNKTTQAIKRLRSRYAFVLTGTPIENRIDELHSLMDFLNPEVLGPLFRFNREYYELDERGRPCGYRNLDQLHARIAPYMLRRRKAEVETELPERSTRNHFVKLSDTQKSAYADHEREVARPASIDRRRPLSP